MKRVFLGTILGAIALGSFPCRESLGQSYEPANSYSYDGFIEAEDDILVSALEMGRVEIVRVKVGDAVVAGQEVARLEDAVQVISLEQAVLLAKMRGKLEAAEAEVSIQQRRTDQLKQVAAKGAARPEEIARSEADLLLAKAHLVSAQEDTEAKQVDVRRQQILLDRRRIHSPVSGIVAAVMCRPGEFISPSNPTVVRVVAKQRVIAVFNLPAQAALKYRVDDNVKVRVSALSRTAEGRIQSIAPAIDSESGTVAIRVLIANADESIYPGDRCELARSNENAPPAKQVRHQAPSQ